MRKSEHEAEGCEKALSTRPQEEALPDRKHCSRSKPQVLDRIADRSEDKGAVEVGHRGPFMLGLKDPVSCLNFI